MPDASTGLVIQFRPPAAHHQFTSNDRIEALHWESSRAIEEGTHVTFQSCVGDDPAACGQYLSIYRGEDRWAVWGAARRGKSIVVWKCSTGADLGHFASMREALAALKTASTKAPVRAAAGRG